MHPADEIRGVKSNRLSNKKIILGVTGSIGCVECVRLARELIRHGASVFPVMTRSATKIISPNALWFATGNPPIVELSGKTEHVFFCGKVKDPADLLLISPCTSNTISKIAHGIDDTSVTTFVTTAIGSKIPVMIVPGMHISMYNHKIVQDNIIKCRKLGITFVEPLFVGNKAKMADIDEIVANVIKKIGRQDLSDKKVLIMGGSTAEKIDDVRVISNLSSGKTAVWLAKNMFYRDADVELWYGQSQEAVPGFIKTIRFTCVNDLLKMLKNTNMKKFDIIFVCAAIADYIPKKHKGKIPSEKNNLVLEMKKAPKIISKLREQAPKTTIIGFKIEKNTGRVTEKAFDLLKKNHLDFVVGNTDTAFDSEENEIWIINKKGDIVHKKDKKEHLTNIIIDTILK